MMDLLSTKELADRLRRHPAYVYAMRRDGFPMPGGRATVAQAIDWLTQNPTFRQHKKRHASAVVSGGQNNTN